MSSVPNDWAMYEHDGNITVSLMMQEMKVLLSTQTLPDVRVTLKEKMAAVSQVYGEIYDTDVRYLIADYLTKWACEVHDIQFPHHLDAIYWDLY